MKKNTLFTLAFVAGSSALLAFAAVDGNKTLSPKLSYDKTPPVRTGPLGGYADVVSKVSPSVVSIFTTREVKFTSGNPGSEQLPDLFNSPMFRDFFGRRGIPSPAPNQSPQRKAPGQQGLGSGVIISEDGYIITNNHVVEDSSDIKVQLDSGKEYAAKIVASDPASDLAVIKVDGTNLPAATIGDSEILRAGDTVLAIGSPFGLNRTVTSGIVSATGRDNLNIVGYENFIQTDASINPGNSGGALIDNKGRVVGINTAIFSRSGGNVGIGFAIPVNMAVKIAEELISDGEIQRGYLGVTLAPLTESLARALKIDKHGALVNDVMADTPADKAGFKAGDVIIEVNERKVEDTADVKRMVGSEKPGSELDFRVKRGRKEITIKATIAKLPGDSLASNNQPAGKAHPGKGALSGVELGAIDPLTKERYGLAPDEDGVIVKDVAPDSKAAMAGLRSGDVILEINQKKISSPRDAVKSSEQSEDVTLLRVTDGNRKRFLAIG